MVVLKEQVFFFANHTLNMHSQDVLQKNWDNVDIKCRPEAYKDALHHVIVMIKTNMDLDFGYNCIHQGALLEEQASAYTHYYWWLIRKEMLEIDSDRKCDCSAKVRRMESSVDADSAPQVVS